MSLAIHRTPEEAAQDRPSYQEPPERPGTELKRLLASYGFVDDDGCGCDDKAAMMDRSGCQWCRDNVDLITGWLIEAAKKRSVLHHTMALAAAKRLVRKAIRRTERASHRSTYRPAEMQ